MTGEARAAVARELALGAEVRSLLLRLDAAGAPVLVLKGTALAYRLYPEPWLRDRQDTDLLVDPARVQKAVDVLHAAGYEELPSIWAITGQRQFLKRSPVRHIVDLHSRLAVPSTFGSLDGYAALSARSVPIPALGPAAYALASPDALLHACVHRVAHHNDSPERQWLYDIHLIASTLDAEGWNAFTGRAARCAVKAICASGLERASAAFATAVPDSVWKDLAARGPERSALFLGGRLTELRIQAISFVHMRRWRDRARLVAAHLFPPPAYMLATYGRSGRWLPLLYPCRILRAGYAWSRPKEADDGGSGASDISFDAGSGEPAR